MYWREPGWQCSTQRQQPRSLFPVRDGRRSRPSDHGRKPRMDDARHTWLAASAAASGGFVAIARFLFLLLTTTTSRKDGSDDRRRQQQQRRPFFILRPPRRPAFANRGKKQQQVVCLYFVYPKRNGNAACSFFRCRSATHCSAD